jgi:uncharacterized membrane protein required for colicin V production
MIVIIIAAALILCIAGFQVVQGLFTALVNAILTLLCAMLAFAYYQDLATVLRENGMQLLADGASLVLLFAVPLLVLRFVVDQLIVKDNLAFGPWADRIGGGALGLFTGIILVGMAAVGMQMMPFDASAMGYLPYDEDLQRHQTLAPFQPDEVVLALADGLSTGSLSAAEDKAFSDIHPNYTLELFCARNRAGRNGRITTPTDALTVKGAYLPPANSRWLEDVPADSLLSKTQQNRSHTVVVRVTVDEQARSEEDDWFRMPGTHFCLVTKDGHRTYPVGYLTYEAIDRYRKKRDKIEIVEKKVKIITNNDVPHLRKETRQNEDDDLSGRGGPGRANLVVLRPWRKNGGPKELTIDWVYKLPENAEPSHVIFRRYSTAAVPEVNQNDLPSQADMLQRVHDD